MAERIDTGYVCVQGEERKGMGQHWISRSCLGERCRACYRDGQTVRATHKLGEEIAHDDPSRHRHNLTAYVCCEHFRLIVGRCGPMLAHHDPKDGQEGRDG